LLSAVAGDSDGLRVRLIRGDTIEPESVRWIWNGWLAAGKFHVLAGRPGTGKTTLATSLAATISIGGRWPDKSGAEPGNVLIWSGEDDPKDTLVPRLIANGADMSRVYFVGESLDPDGKPVSFDPARHMAALEREAALIGGVRLLIVDPVVSAVSGDGNSNTEVRRALQPIVDLAARLDCAALGISHFTKGSDGRDVVERVTGSLAFGAAARVVLAAAKLKDDDQTAGRIVARAKSNIGPDSGGFGYDLQQVELPDYPGVLASRVLWSGAIEGTARELLHQAEADDEGDGGNPRQFLADLLANGPMKAPEVFRDAEAHGYSKRQMQRACKRLGIKPTKAGMSGGWIWALPEDAGYDGKGTEDAEDSGFTPPAPSAPWPGAFGSEDTAPDTKILEDAGHKNAAPSAPSAREWRITRANGESFNAHTTRLVTVAQMVEQYPGMTVEPITGAGA
jgi:putative DNA primase/helicase